MEFLKEISAKGAFIPRASLALSGFAEKEEAKLHTLPGVTALTKKKMNASELCETIESLADLTTDLIICLANACKGCDDCDECSECPEDCPQNQENYLNISPLLLESVGIPAGARLYIETDAEAGTITISKAEYEPALRDISLGLLDLLKKNGVCLSRLEKCLASKDVIYK